MSLGGDHCPRCGSKSYIPQSTHLKRVDGVTLRRRCCTKGHYFWTVECSHARLRDLVEAYVRYVPDGEMPTG